MFPSSVGLESQIHLLTAELEALKERVNEKRERFHGGRDIWPEYTDDELDASQSNQIRSHSLDSRLERKISAKICSTRRSSIDGRKGKSKVLLNQRNNALLRGRTKDRRGQGDVIADEKAHHKDNDLQIVYRLLSSTQNQLATTKELLRIKVNNAKLINLDSTK